LWFAFFIPRSLEADDSPVYPAFAGYTFVDEIAPRWRSKPARPADAATLDAHAWAEVPMAIPFGFHGSFFRT